MVETILVGQPAFLLGMNVFEIGGNKEHINKGLMGSQIASDIAPKIAKISNVTKNLVIPGYVLDLLEEFDEESLDSLKSLVEKNNISLFAVPYYNSSISLMSKEELIKQLDLQEASLKKHFGKQSEGFFCSESVLPPVLEKSLNEQNYSKVFYPKGASLTLTNPTYKLVETETSSIGEELTKPMHHADSEMETHLISEIKDMYPHILNYGDEETLTTWRYMSQPSMIMKAGVDSHSGNAYEHYTQMMNTLNDIAHKMNTVKLAKKGLFQEKPIISMSPSTLLSQD